MNRDLTADLRKLATRIKAVQQASLAESTKLEEAKRSKNPDAFLQLVTAHETEVDAIQVLVAWLDIVERRHKDIFAEQQTYGLTTHFDRPDLT